MRVKQTARKSTGAHMNTAGSTSSRSSQNSDDPVRTRMQHLLQTKRKSATPQGRKSEPVSGRGKGKRISGFSQYEATVKTKPRAKSGAMALKEIKRLQKGYELLIPRAPFHRLVREITHQVVLDNNKGEESESSMKYQTAALEALQEAAENYLTTLFEDSYMCTIHAKRVTLFVSDMILCKRLQSRGGPSR